MLVLSTLLEPYGVTVARLTLDQFAKVRILVRQSLFGGKDARLKAPTRSESRSEEGLNRYGFDYDKLRNAVIETFENRKTTMTMDSAAFAEGFLNDPIHLTRWNAFLKKKKAIIQVSLPDAMAQIKNFVRPLIEGGNVKKWNSDDCCWE